MYKRQPYDLETICELQKLTEILRNRGYSEEDVTAIMHGNWIRQLNEIWS